MILSPFVVDERQEASPQYVVNNLEINPFTLNLNPNEHHAQRVVLDLTLTSSSWPAFLVLRATRQPSSRVRSFWSPAPSLMVSRGGCRFCSPLYGVHREGKSKKRAPMTPINPADEFLKHAAECRQMAKATRNPAGKATWNRMAVRWLQCAERAKNQKVATRARVPVRRQAEISSAHY